MQATHEMQAPKHELRNDFSQQREVINDQTGALPEVLKLSNTKLQQKNMLKLSLNFVAACC
jgi:hypothetical protein